MKRQVFHSKFKQVLSWVLCAIMVISFAACGQSSEEKSIEETENSADEYVYVPEFITLGDEQSGYFGNITLTEKSIYYSQYSYDEDTMTSKQTITEYSLADGGLKEIPVQMAENRNLDYFAMDGAGNTYTLFSDYSSEKVNEEGFSEPDLFICKYDSRGTVLFEKDITEIVNRESEQPYTRGILADEQGRIYICMESVVIMLDENGEEHGAVGISDGWINSFGFGKDGKLYISYYDYTSATGGTVLSVVDYETKKMGEKYTNLPNMNGNFSVGITKDFLMNDGSRLYEYDLATQTYEEVLSWLDCDINGSFVSSVGTMEDGTLAAVLNNWETGVTELAKLNLTKADEVVQKEEIVIGALYDDQELQASAVAFNKSNDKYRITIKSYLQGDWDGDAYNTALTNMQNDIVSGTDCPDIVDLSRLENESQLAGKGVFEDLTPYLEQSTILHKDDYFESVLEAFSHEGKLLSIPNTFELQTVVGKASVVGEEMGWSLDEMMACVKEHPESVLLDGAQKSSILYSCLMFNQNAFVDWETGECHFDTDTFKQVLEFANMFPEEYDWENYDGSDSVEKLQSDAVLLENVYVYDIQEIQVYEAKFGEPVTFVGFPTTDGSVGCSLSASSRYGIVAKSENKDGAWAFIEYYLTNKSDRYSWGIPTRKSEFEKMITDATTPDYVLDENGEPILDENGEPMVSGTSSMSSDGWEYTYHTPTMEDAEILRQLIAEAKLSALLDADLTSIILEEAEPYFSGQKSVDEVVSIIQSRAQIYISENS